MPIYVAFLIMIMEKRDGENRVSKIYSIQCTQNKYTKHCQMPQNSDKAHTPTPALTHTHIACLEVGRICIH